MKQTLKLSLLIVLVSLLFLQTDVVIKAEGVVEEDNEQRDDAQLIDDLSLTEVQKYWQELARDYGGYLPELNKNSLYEMIKASKGLSLKGIFSGLFEFLFHEVIANGKLLGMLLMLTLCSSVLQTMHAAFENSVISKLAYFVVYIVLLYLALNSFFLVFSYTKETIDMMGSFMIALLPLVLGLLASIGSVISVSFFHPFVLFLINSSSILISKFILPLLFLSVLLYIVSTLNENYQVTHFANLLKSISLSVLGLFLTIFLGIMSVQGTVSAIEDGVAMKTTKFITGNFIPVVGRTFTDATDTILSASLLLKNAVGVVGLFVIIVIAIFPALKIFAIAFTYKIAAAVLQPIGDGPIITCLNMISKYITYILACLLVVTLMFFLSIVIIVASSNITLLLR